MNLSQSLIFLTFSASVLFAEANFPGQNPDKLSVQNAILVKVNDQTISVVDVIKKMDLLLHQNYPQYADSSQARYQFYSSNWRPILMEMIDNELILADAENKEMKISDGEVREEMERRFGPNVLATLEKIGVSYEDTWKMVKNDQLVQRMVWFFVQSKAIQAVGPQAIRQAYKEYLAQHPAYQNLTYRVISVRSQENGKSLSEEIHRRFTEANRPVESLADFAADLEKLFPSCSIQVSNEYAARDCDLSESHKIALNSLEKGSYSQPIEQISRTERKPVYRIFYLAEKRDHPAPAFEDVASQLRQALTQKHIAKESEQYLQKLRSRYGFDSTHLKETVPEDLQPFQLQ